MSRQIARWGWLGLLWAVVAGATAPPAVAQNAPQPGFVPAPAPTDPLVQAVLETRPETPMELLSATETLLNLNAAQHARQFLATLGNMQLDDEAVAGLVDRFGSGFLLRIAREPGLQPEGGRIARSFQEAALRYHHDPARLAELVAAVSDPEPRARARAVSSLRRSGQPGVTALIAALADPGREAEHPSIREALAALGAEARGPLTGTLHSPDPRLRAQAAAVLAAIGAYEAAPFMLSAPFDPDADPVWAATSRAALRRLLDRELSRDEAIGLLERHAAKYFGGELPAAPDMEGRLLVWNWDVAQSEPIAARLTPEHARWLYAWWMARDLAALRPDDPVVQEMYATALLQMIAFDAEFRASQAGAADPAADQAGQPAAGPADPLVQENPELQAALDRLQPEALLSILRRAMADRRWPAARAAARLLQDRGSAEMLTAGGVSPVVIAATSPDLRLRRAALGAIAAWDGQRRYAGTSDVARSLAWMARGGGEPVAVIADTRSSDVSRITGYLAELGFEPAAAVNGRDFLKLAHDSSDVVVALVDARLSWVDADRLIQQLRADRRTAQLPVVLLARNDDLRHAERLAGLNPPAGVIVRPYGPQAMEIEFEQWQKAAGVEFVPTTERREAAVFAMQTLADWASRPKSPYDLLQLDREIEPALYRDATAAAAAQFLGQLGTPLGQRLLVNWASQPTAPTEQRRTAADAFRAAVERHGILLTTVEIQQQYDRYNASAVLDEDTQDILGHILDSLESRLPEEEPAAPAAAVPAAN